MVTKALPLTDMALGCSDNRRGIDNTRKNYHVRSCV